MMVLSSIPLHALCSSVQKKTKKKIAHKKYETRRRYIWLDHSIPTHRLSNTSRSKTIKTDNTSFRSNISLIRQRHDIVDVTS